MKNILLQGGENDREFGFPTALAIFSGVRLIATMLALPLAAPSANHESLLCRRWSLALSVGQEFPQRTDKAIEGLILDPFSSPRRRSRPDVFWLLSHRPWPAIHSTCQGCRTE